MDALVRTEERHVLRSSRLTLRPVGPEHLRDLIALKGDEAAFGLMLGGTRSPVRAEQELHEDIAFWKRGYGTWAVHLTETGAFLGLTGLMLRPDGLGVGLRFALWPWVRGKGYAREAARAALDFGHAAGLRRVIAVARESNLASRAVLVDMGMLVCGGFQRDGNPMLVYESLAPGQV